MASLSPASTPSQRQRDHHLELEYGNTFSVWKGPVKFVEGKSRNVEMKSGEREKQASAKRDRKGAAGQKRVKEDVRVERTGSLLIEEIIDEVISPSPSSSSLSPSPTAPKAPRNPLPIIRPTSASHSRSNPASSSIPHARAPTVPTKKLLIEQQVIDLTLSSPSPAATPQTRKRQTKRIVVGEGSPIRPRGVPIYGDRVCYDAMTPPKPQPSTSTSSTTKPLKPIHPFFTPASATNPVPSASTSRIGNMVGARPPPSRNIPRMSARMLQTSSSSGSGSGGTGSNATSSQETDGSYSGTGTESGTSSQESRSSAGHVDAQLGKDPIVEAGLEEVFDELYLDALAEVGKPAEVTAGKESKERQQAQTERSGLLLSEEKIKGKGKDLKSTLSVPQTSNSSIQQPVNTVGQTTPRSDGFSAGNNVKQARGDREQRRVTKELSEVEDMVERTLLENTMKPSALEEELSEVEGETSMVEAVDGSEKGGIAQSGGRVFREPSEDMSAKTHVPTNPPVYRTKASDEAEAVGMPFFSFKTYSPHLPINQQHDPSVTRPTSRPPHLVYTDDRDEASDLLDLLKGDVLGFDIEWATRWRRAPQGKGAMFLEGKTALVQVCDENIIVLIHLARMTGFPKRLRQLILDGKKLKLGVNIRGDGHKLRKDFIDLQPAGLYELSWLARQVEPDEWGPGFALVSLARLTQRYTGFAMYKGNDVRQSSWDKVLSDDQKEYAGNDVFASVMIYKRLMEMAVAKGIQVNQRMCLVEEGAEQRHAATAPAVSTLSTVPRDRVASENTLGKALRCFMMFAMGDSLEQIGKAMRSPEQPLKPGTIRKYLFQAVITDPTLKIKDKPRFYRALSPGRGEPYNSNEPGYMDLLARLEQEISAAP